MNGQVGNYTIKPDQMPLVNAISTAIFVPFCEYFLNPLIAKVGIRTSLQRVVLGGFLSGTAFVIAALLQFQVDRQEQLHMVWQIPQHMVLALGEVLVYVQFLQFAYTQAPRQMKSVLQAFFSMVIGGGNLIVALIASTEIFESMAYEYLMFAGIVYIAMIAFAILAVRYKYVVVETDDKKNDEIVKSGDLDNNEDSVKDKYDTRL
jgi:dipeptide/tripeptide permease